MVGANRELGLFDVVVFRSTSRLQLPDWRLRQTPPDVGDGNKSVEDEVDKHGELYQTVDLDSPYEHQDQQTLHQYTNTAIL